jgi:hypothetical protein
MDYDDPPGSSASGFDQSVTESTFPHPTDPAKLALDEARYSEASYKLEKPVTALNDRLLKEDPIFSEWTIKRQYDLSKHHPDLPTAISARCRKIAMWLGAKNKSVDFEFMIDNYCRKLESWATQGRLEEWIRFLYDTDDSSPNGFKRPEQNQVRLLSKTPSTNDETQSIDDKSQSADEDSYSDYDDLDAYKRTMVEALRPFVWRLNEKLRESTSFIPWCMDPDDVYMQTEALVESIRENAANDDAFLNAKEDTIRLVQMVEQHKTYWVWCNFLHCNLEETFGMSPTGPEYAQQLQKIAEASRDDAFETFFVLFKALNDLRHGLQCPPYMDIYTLEELLDAFVMHTWDVANRDVSMHWRVIANNEETLKAWLDAGNVQEWMHQFATLLPESPPVQSGSGNMDNTGVDEDLRDMYNNFPDDDDSELSDLLDAPSIFDGDINSNHRQQNGANGSSHSDHGPQEDDDNMRDVMDYAQHNVEEENEHLYGPQGTANQNSGFNYGSEHAANLEGNNGFNHNHVEVDLDAGLPFASQGDVHMDEGPLSDEPVNGLDVDLPCADQGDVHMDEGSLSNEPANDQPSSFLQSEPLPGRMMDTDVITAEPSVDKQSPPDISQADSLMLDGPKRADPAVLASRKLAIPRTRTPRTASLFRASGGLYASSASDAPVSAFTHSTSAIPPVRATIEGTTSISVAAPHNSSETSGLKTPLFNLSLNTQQAPPGPPSHFSSLPSLSSQPSNGFLTTQPISGFDFGNAFGGAGNPYKSGGWETVGIASLLADSGRSDTLPKTSSNGSNTHSTSNSGDGRIFAQLSNGSSNQFKFDTPKDGHSVVGPNSSTNDGSNSTHSSSLNDRDGTPDVTKSNKSHGTFSASTSKDVRTPFDFDTPTEALKSGLSKLEPTTTGHEMLEKTVADVQSDLVSKKTSPLNVNTQIVKQSGVNSRINKPTKHKSDHFPPGKLQLRGRIEMLPEVSTLETPSPANIPFSHRVNETVSQVILGQRQLPEFSALLASRPGSHKPVMVSQSAKKAAFVPLLSISAAANVANPWSLSSPQNTPTARKQENSAPSMTVTSSSKLADQSKSHRPTALCGPVQEDISTSSPNLNIEVECDDVRELPPDILQDKISADMSTNSLASTELAVMHHGEQPRPSAIIDLTLEDMPADDAREMHPDAPQGGTADEQLPSSTLLAEVTDKQDTGQSPAIEEVTISIPVATSLPNPQAPLALGTLFQFNTTGMDVLEAPIEESRSNLETSSTANKVPLTINFGTLPSFAESKKKLARWNQKLQGTQQLQEAQTHTTEASKPAVHAATTRISFSDRHSEDALADASSHGKEPHGTEHDEPSTQGTATQTHLSDGQVEDEAETVSSNSEEVHEPENLQGHLNSLTDDDLLDMILPTEDDYRSSSSDSESNGGAEDISDSEDEDDYDGEAVDGSDSNSLNQSHVDSEAEARAKTNAEHENGGFVDITITETVSRQQLHLSGHPDTAVSSAAAPNFELPDAELGLAGNLEEDLQSPPVLSATPENSNPADNKERETPKVDLSEKDPDHRLLLELPTAPTPAPATNNKSSDAAKLPLNGHCQPSTSRLDLSNCREPMEVQLAFLEQQQKLQREQAKCDQLRMNKELEGHKMEIRAIAKQHEEQIQTLHKQYQEAVGALNEQHKKDMHACNEQHKKEMDAWKETHTKAITSDREATHEDPHDTNRQGSRYEREPLSDAMSMPQILEKFSKLQEEFRLTNMRPTTVENSLEHQTKSQSAQAVDPDTAQHPARVSPSKTRTVVERPLTKHSKLARFLILRLEAPPITGRRLVHTVKNSAPAETITQQNSVAEDTPAAEEMKLSAPVDSGEQHFLVAKDGPVVAESKLRGSMSINKQQLSVLAATATIADFEPPSICRKVQPRDTTMSSRPRMDRRHRPFLKDAAEDRHRSINRPFLNDNAEDWRYNINRAAQNQGRRMQPALNANQYCLDDFLEHFQYKGEINFRIMIDDRFWIRGLVPDCQRTPLVQQVVNVVKTVKNGFKKTISDLAVPLHQELVHRCHKVFDEGHWMDPGKIKELENYISLVESAMENVDEVHKHLLKPDARLTTLVQTFRKHVELEKHHRQRAEESYGLYEMFAPQFRGPDAETIKANQQAAACAKIREKLARDMLRPAHNIRQLYEDGFARLMDRGGLPSALKRTVQKTVDKQTREIHKKLVVAGQVFDVEVDLAS